MKNHRTGFPANRGAGAATKRGGPLRRRNISFLNLGEMSCGIASIGAKKSVLVIKKPTGKSLNGGRGKEEGEKGKNRKENWDLEG